MTMAASPIIAADPGSGLRSQLAPTAKSALLRSGFAIEAVDVARVYGGVALRALARGFRFGAASGLPPSVRAMLSSSRVLCGRTALVRARAQKP